MLDTRVRTAFFAITPRLEGALRCMYPDQHRDKDGNLGPLVTTGDGQLIDAGPGSSDRAAPALRVVWTHGEGGAIAEEAEVRAEFARILAFPPALALRGGGTFAKGAVLLATPESLRMLFEETLEADDAHVAKAIGAAYGAAPADAIVGALDMAWAMGGDFAVGYPKWLEAFRAGEYETCAAECDIRHPVTSGIAARNAANRTLFENAAQVVERGLDRAVVYYPRVLKDAPTEPAPAPSSDAADG